MTVRLLGVVLLRWLDRARNWFGRALEVGDSGSCYTSVPLWRPWRDF